MTDFAIVVIASILSGCFVALMQISSELSKIAMALKWRGKGEKP